MKVVLAIGFWLMAATLYAQTNTTIEAKLDDLQEGTVIYIYPISSPAKKDSVIAGKGGFQFNLKLDEGDAYFLTIGKVASKPGYAYLFYVQPGMVKIKAKGPMLTGAELSGSSFANESNDLSEFIRDAPGLSGADKLSALLNEANEKKDSVKLIDLRRQYRKLDSVRSGLYEEWISRHPASPISAMALSVYVRGRDMKKIESIFNLLKTEAKQNALAKKIQYSIDASKLTAVGKGAPDFIQNDTSGKPVALKDFRGKYVLIDFWASWCVPCRAENPNVVKAFNTFRDKNFTVLGVSLDREGAKERWLQAIHEDGLTWTHVSDLKFWDNAVARLYDINSIPSNLLIGQNGEILAKNIRGGELLEILKKFIN